MNPGSYVYNALVTEVYDGDTITVDVDLGMHVVLRGIKIRLARINAPEMRGLQKERGIASRDWLRCRILGRHVIINTFKDKRGKYGRYIAEVYLRNTNTNINIELVRQDLAEFKEY